jgi:hypothetical protein
MKSKAQSTKPKTILKPKAQIIETGATTRGLGHLDFENLDLF